MRHAMILALLLAGCTVPPTDARSDDTVSVFKASYKAQPLHPLNCGTPEEFVICPLPQRPDIWVEPLMDLELPTDSDQQ